VRSVIKGTEFEGWLTPRTARKTDLTLVDRTHGSVVASKVAGHSDDKLIASTHSVRMKLAPDVRDLTQKHQDVVRPA
jgi:hypothetical protein